MLDLCMLAFLTNGGARQKARANIVLRGCFFVTCSAKSKKVAGGVDGTIQYRKLDARNGKPCCPLTVKKTIIRR
jgi:hypothetical protein